MRSSVYILSLLFLPPSFTLILSLHIALHMNNKRIYTYTTLSLIAPSSGMLLMLIVLNENITNGATTYPVHMCTRIQHITRVNAHPVLGCSVAVAYTFDELCIETADEQPTKQTDMRVP